MKSKLIAAAGILSISLFNSCGQDSAHKSTANAADVAVENNKRKVDELNKQYPRIPDDKILENNGSTSALYAELKGRYTDNLTKLKQDVAAVGAQLVVIIITPEAGKQPTLPNVYGIPYIKSTCSQLGVECIDMSPALATQDLKVITQTPKDGHWSKKGAIFLASQLSPIIKKHSDAKSTVTYKDSERPETFGDLPPNDDEVLDGGKNLPYHLTANAQGCRMSHNLKFPKTKQNILFLGGSQIYSPFLDNEFIATTLLEKEFPNAEMINTGMIASSLDDYVSLFEEKAKYCEPDLVIVQTNGGDITDFFFSNRNHLSRIQKPRTPSPEEVKFYAQAYGK